MNCPFCHQTLIKRIAETKFICCPCDIMVISYEGEVGDALDYAFILQEDNLSAQIRIANFSLFSDYQKGKTHARRIKNKMFVGPIIQLPFIDILDKMNNLPKLANLLINLVTFQ